MNKTKEPSLADKIGDLLSAAPASIDPEDDLHEDTRAKVEDHLQESGAQEDELLSSFRRKNAQLLEETDVKYEGRKTSRKELLDSDESVDEDAEISAPKRVKQDADSDENGDDAAGEDEDQLSGGSVVDESEDGSAFEEEQDASSGDEDATFQPIDSSKVSKELDKGVAVRNQLKMWESLLEMRIQLQKSVTAANRMPQGAVYTTLQQTSEQFAQKSRETAQTATSTLLKLLDLQQLLLRRWPETTKLLDKTPKTPESDEEILSDTDPEPEPDLAPTKPPRKRRKLNDLEPELSDIHTKYGPYRDDVIRRWYEKTRAATSAKSGPVYSVLHQIEHSLRNDKARLLKRSQLKRIQADKTEPESEPEHDPEIYDDNDFYHQQLRELIEVKSADLTDPVQLGRQWVQLQSLRSKMKRSVDTRATKGRKIRYTVHNKLVNFMAPIHDNAWSDEAKTELYSSLFSKRR